MPIDFYYAPGSGPCRFIELTAKTLGVNLNYKELDLMVKKEHLTPEFIKINPQHCIPTIVDNGFALWESPVIATYLVEAYGKTDSLYPKDPKKKAAVDQRLYFNNGVLYQRLADYYYPIIWGNATPDPQKYKKVEEALQFLDTFLGADEYVAGDSLTLADFAIATTLSTFDVAKLDRSAYKNVSRWYKMLQTSVPAFEEINGLEKLTKMFDAIAKKAKS
ncbi:glutathione S-transferase D1-like [Photinus pyralis]|uniref:glutathione S-transferase D1-like n=1 Tax=Photinus pyralis TaxID=7054 RepID=UPI001266EF72|nr:glutathione S-transferase D1-like [Photinus pyralis]